MISFFGQPQGHVFAVQSIAKIDVSTVEKLQWLFGGQALLAAEQLTGPFIGPRAAMVTPWSTNAVEITENMGRSGQRHF
jgi:phosphoribosylformylglycinamidine synthase